jgi:hypothetical protein
VQCYVYFIWKRENGMDFVPKWHGKSAVVFPSINIMFIDHEINMDTKIISHISGFLIPVNVITIFRR